MKKIEIEIPDGKHAKWVNNVLTLVDEDVTERIKTFEDACAELSNVHPFVSQYYYIAAAYKGAPMTKDFIAYLKLRIITTALNEGWKPQFIKENMWWYPWFDIVQGGLVCASAHNAGASSFSYSGVRMAFKSQELAEYAGKQFIDIYKDFCFKTSNQEQ